MVSRMHTRGSNKVATTKALFAERHQVADNLKAILQYEKQYERANN